MYIKHFQAITFVIHVVYGTALYVDFFPSCLSHSAFGYRRWFKHNDNGTIQHIRASNSHMIPANCSKHIRCNYRCCWKLKMFFFYEYCTLFLWCTCQCSRIKSRALTQFVFLNDHLMCTAFSKPHKSTWSKTRPTECNALLVNGFSSVQHKHITVHSLKIEEYCFINMLHSHWVQDY